jgi:hypothetical protein
MVTGFETIPEKKTPVENTTSISSTSTDSVP